MPDKSFSTNDPGKPQSEGSNNTQGTSFETPPSDPLGQNGGNDPTKNVDVNKLEKRLADSQQFIEVLKSERQSDRQKIEELEAKIQSAPTLDEIMEHINQNPSNTGDPVNPEDLVNKTVDAVQQQLSQTAQEEKEAQNIKEVSQILQSQFGDNVDTKVSELAANNDMSFDEIYDLARKKPKVALKLLGIEQEDASKTTPSPTSSLNSIAVMNQPQDPPKRQTIMDMRTERDRVNYLQERMNQRLKELGV